MFTRNIYILILLFPTTMKNQNFLGSLSFVPTIHLMQNAVESVYIIKVLLPLRVIKIGYLHEWLSFELQIGDKICNFVAFYRSPRQSQDDFETFADDFEMTLELLAQKNLFLVTAIDDFNAKIFKLV